MLTPIAIAKLTDDALIERLRQSCLDSKRLLAELILLLIEVERRRLHLKSASPSPFEFCVRRLNMSEGEAYRRCNAARLVARFPRLLPYIERGDIHLSALVQLRDYFTEENVDDLVEMSRKKNKMEIAELVARLAPRPDVPARLRKVPRHDTSPRVTQASKSFVDPLSEARYRLQMTGSREFRDKLFRLRDLMMHTNPTGDLAVVIERAVEDLLEKLERRVFGKLARKPTSSQLVEEGVEAVAVPARTVKGDAKSKSDDARRPGIARTSMQKRAAGDKVARTRVAQAGGQDGRGSLAPAQVVRAGEVRRIQAHESRRRHSSGV